MISRLKNWWNNTDRKQVIAVLMLFLLAFGVRAHLMEYELLFGFDSYWHARMVPLLIENGTMPVNDPLAYYQLDEAPVGNPAPVFWYLTAGIYKIFTLNAPYDQDTWIVFVKLLPAFFGALISVMMFFVLKEMFGKKVGYIAGYSAAIFAAIVPSFVYRTMTGFFEEDSLGFLWMLIGFYFLIRALKEPELAKNNIINTIIAGIFFGIMAWTWGMFILVYLVLGAFGGITIWLMYLREKQREIFIGYLGAFGLAGFLIFLAYLSLNLLRDLPFATSLWSGAILILVILGFVSYLGVISIFLYYRSKTPQLIKSFTVLFILMMVIFSGLSTAHKGTSWLDSMTTYVSDYIPVSEENIERAQSTGPGVLQATIGEESIGNKYWGTKYNALILLSFFALLLVPLYIWRNPNDRVSLILFFWVVIALFMAWNKLKFTYVLGLPIAASAGLVFYEAFLLLQTRPVFEKKIIALGMGFMMLVGVGAGTYFVTEKFPNIEQNNGWKEALYWMKDNTPEDAKFFNWWDEGHWITFIGERGVIEDNRNYHFEADSATAQFILTEDESTAYSLVKEFGSDYVIMSSDLLSKMGSMVLYAYNTDDKSDPRTRLYLGIQMPCSKSIDELSQAVTYFCGGNVLTEQQLNSLPSVYQTMPNQVDQGVPLFVYRDADYGSVYLLNPKSNATMLARIWFNDPEIEHFTEVYGNQGVKIFKVN